MALTAPEFKTDYPEFTSEDDARIERLLNRAALRLNETEWGECYDEGQGLVTAHLLARAKESAASDGKGQGPITSARIDDQFQKSYAQPSQTNKSASSSEYSSTTYGQQFIELRNSITVPLRII